MQKHKLRFVLPQNLIAKADSLRKLYGGVSRSAIVGIAIKSLYESEAPKKTAPTQEREAA